MDWKNKTLSIVCGIGLIAAAAWMENSSTKLVLDIASAGIAFIGACCIYDGATK